MCTSFDIIYHNISENGNKQMYGRIIVYKFLEWYYNKKIRR